MIELTENEIKFLKTREDARIATSHDNIPHVKPVSFIFNKYIIIATDYETRSFKNIQSNPNVAVAIDHYKLGKHKAVCVQGKASIIENGPEFERLYEIFYKKFEWVRRDPWREGEAPFLKITPYRKSSWGLN